MSGQRHGDHLARAVPVQLGDATLASLRPVAVPARTVFFHAGDPDDRLYIVLEGEVALIEGLDSPSERLTSVRGPGDLHGHTQPDCNLELQAGMVMDNGRIWRLSLYSRMPIARLSDARHRKTWLSLM